MPREAGRNSTTSRIRNLYCPNSKMPKLRYTDDQLKALIDFLLSLK